METTATRNARTPAMPGAAPSAATGVVYVCSSVDIEYVDFLARCVGASGATVRKITAITEADYRAAGNQRRLRRLLLRVRMYVTYPLMLLACVLRGRRGDVFIVTSNTFFAPLLVAWAGRLKRLATIHMLYDLFPDALEVSGRFVPGGLGSRWVGAVARRTQSTCRGCVFLGEFLRRHAEMRWGKNRHSAAIHIGVDASRYPRELPHAPSDRVVIHYGGQIGHMHDAHNLCAAVQRVLERPERLSRPVIFDFSVSGAQVPVLTHGLRGPGVHIRAAVPAAEWRRQIAQFHVGLVSLSPGGATVCLPSKTYAMMAGGLAILALCPRWSDLARLIEENDAGWVVDNSPLPPEGPLAGPGYLAAAHAVRPAEEIAAEFEHVVAMIASSPQAVQSKRVNAQRAAHERYSLAPLSTEWKRYMQGIAGP